MIFNHTLPLFERVIRINPASSITRDYDLSKLRPSEIVTTSRPTLLHINHEIRVELFKYYASPFNSIALPELRHLVISWQSDILYFDGITAWDSFKGPFRRTAPGNGMNEVFHRAVSFTVLFSPEGLEEIRRELCRLAMNANSLDYTLKLDINTTLNGEQAMLSDFGGLKVFIIVSTRAKNSAARMLWLDLRSTGWKSCGNASGSELVLVGKGARWHCVRIVRD
ncbi:hypothetical protein VTL71DRAFT_15443 [Oculimacula yallundae]|uniref:Uncharacterized protein n=1 Tax=Oculimacula yallundae TaxID=86028 RepID=A0ABR4CGM5_9HELO